MAEYNINGSPVGGLPTGGTNGQVVTKVAGVAAWADAASGLPTASGADQFPASTGAGTTYTTRTAAQVRTVLGVSNGHAWERPAASAGVSFFDTDTLIQYASTGAYWTIDFGRGAACVTDKAGIVMTSG